MDWIVPCPASYVKVLTPSVSVFGDRAYKDVIIVKRGHKGGILIS